VTFLPFKSRLVDCLPFEIVRRQGDSDPQSYSCQRGSGRTKERHHDYYTKRYEVCRSRKSKWPVRRSLAWPIEVTRRQNTPGINLFVRRCHSSHSFPNFAFSILSSSRTLVTIPSTDSVPKAVNTIDPHPCSDSTMPGDIHAPTAPSHRMNKARFAARTIA
jgi:hypothetical protein